MPDYPNIAVNGEVIPCGGFLIDTSSFRFMDNEEGKPVLMLVAGGGGDNPGVTSFNGRAGVVVPQKGDYTPIMIGAVATDAPSVVTQPIDLQYVPTQGAQAANKQYVDTQITQAGANKQNKLDGAKGSIVSFDANGNAVSTDKLDCGDLG